MSLGRQLYDLQEIDLDSESKAEMLKRVEGQLLDNRAVAEARAELDRKQERLSELKTEQRTAEWAIDDLQAKTNPLQEKLYGSSIKNPKELLSLQHQVESLKAQISDREDKVLEIMGQVEIAQGEIA